MNRREKKEIIKKLILTLPIPETQEGHDYMQLAISNLIVDLQKPPYLQVSEVMDKIKKPFTHTWEVKGKAIKIDKLHKKIKATLKKWNLLPIKLNLDAENS